MRPTTTSTPAAPASGTDLPTALAVGQGAFYLATGIWPLVDIRSFQAVTGPKADLWLVKTVGVLVGVIGGGLLAAGLRRHVPRELGAVAAGSALGLAAVDVNYVARGRISPVYLLDAAVEIALAGAWLAARGGHASAGTPDR